MITGIPTLEHRVVGELPPIILEKYPGEDPNECLEIMPVETFNLAVPVFLCQKV
jgi:hypothetical protein